MNTEAGENAPENESSTKATEEKTTAGIGTKRFEAKKSCASGSIAAETKPQATDETLASDKATDAKKVNVRAFLMCQGRNFALVHVVIN